MELEQLTVPRRADKASSLSESPMGRAMFTIIGAKAELESDLDICDIQKKVAGRASRGIVREITKRARATHRQAL